MPPLPAAGPAIRVSHKWTMQEDTDVQSRIYLSYAGTAPTNANMATFANALATAYGTDLKPLATGTAILVEISCEDLSSLSGAVGVWTGSVAGTRSGGGLPANVATLLNFQIARRYRGGKPRVYLPFGTDTDLNDQQTWSPSFVSAVNSGWSSYITAASAAPWSGASAIAQANVSYYSGHTAYQNPITLRWYNLNTPRAAGDVVIDPIIGHTCNSKYGTQRRRVNA